MIPHFNVAASSRPAILIHRQNEWVIAPAHTPLESRKDERKR
jgi:hypothetical protein